LKFDPITFSSQDFIYSYFDLPTSLRRRQFHQQSSSILKVTLVAEARKKKEKKTKIK